MLFAFPSQSRAALLAALCLALPGAHTRASSIVKTWRPFSDDSPWNQPIPASAASDRDSPAMIADFASRGAFFVNIADWSVPVYFIDATRTPKHDVGDSRPGIYGAGFGFPRQIPIPADAVASPPFIPESDNHLCIVDRRLHLEWGMWLAQKDSAGRWFTGLGAVTDLSGTGVAPPWFASAREFDSHRARASGFPLIAGLMLLEEFRAGRIDHALVFAYDHCRTELFVPPASTAQANTQDAIHARGIPMGGRLQLDPAWDVEHSALSPAGKIIARALQEYGAFCGDYAGANVLYAENSPAATRAWQDLLNKDELAAVFTPDFIRTHFRVVDLGNMLPGQNLSLPPPYILGCSAPARIDQLTRTISFDLPALPGELRWTTFPAGSRVVVEDSPAPSASLAGRREFAANVTAPNGATSRWQVVTASHASEK